MIQANFSKGQMAMNVETAPAIDLAEVTRIIETATKISRARHEAESHAIETLIRRAKVAEPIAALALLEEAKELLA